MTDFKEFTEAFVLPMLLAIFGGLARMARFGTPSWKQFLSAIVLSAFTGVLVALLMQELAWPESVKSAIIAISGYSGGIILDAMVDRVVRGVAELPGPGQKRD